MTENIPKIFMRRKTSEMEVNLKDRKSARKKFEEQMRRKTKFFTLPSLKNVLLNFLNRFLTLIFIKNSRE